MASYYVKSGAGAAEFAQLTAYTSGQKIVPKRSDNGTNHLVAKRYVWECTTAGTTAAAEPTWPASVTADTTTITSDTAVFTARKPGYSSGTTADWSFATIYLDYVGALAVAGDTVYVSHQHAENVSTAWGGGTLTSGLITGVNYVCVNDGVIPPTALATTASVTTTGAFNITVGSSNSYIYGVSFIVGVTDTATRGLSANGFFERCSFQLASTGASSSITPSGRWMNCTVKFAAAGQSIIVNAGAFFWLGGSLLSGGTSPTALLTNSGVVYIDSVDLSNASASINLCNAVSTACHLKVSRVKLPASWSGVLASGSVVSMPQLIMNSVDNSGTNYQQRSKHQGGETFSETTVVRSGGASDGTTSISYKLVASSIAQFPSIWCCTPEIVKWNDTTGAALNVTVEFLHDSLTALTNKEIWMEVTYYSASGSPLGAIVSSAPEFTTSASDTSASAASWTTTGLTNPNSRKLVAQVTPALKGYVSVKVYLGKASTTVYVDPKLAIAAA